MDLLLNTKQIQKLSQKMIQSSEILQMNSQELSLYIKDSSLSNPLVDLDEPIQETEETNQLYQKLEWIYKSDEQNRYYYKEEQNISDDSWKFKYTLGETLKEYLLSQIVFLNISKEETNILYYLLDCLDNDGYLREDIDEISSLYSINKNVLNKMLALLQSLEPAGVGARDLKECLLIQTERTVPPNILVKNIIKNDLNALGKNQLHNIAKKYTVSINDIIAANNIIKDLNPKPGNIYSSDSECIYLKPDIFVVNNNGNLETSINESLLPTISINKYYKSLLDNPPSDDCLKYLHNKLKQAHWIMCCVDRRSQTLSKTVDAIVGFQSEFFIYGKSHIKPLRLSDVSGKINLHESTVSRAIKDKYLQCQWGVYPLRHFFSCEILTQTNKGISSEEIKSMLTQIIFKENKKTPLSDQAIVEKLTKAGVNISRRTIAKYRDALHIPPAALRKQY